MLTNQGHLAHERRKSWESVLRAGLLRNEERITIRKKGREIMTAEHDCTACSQAGGCAARRTEEKNVEEISAAPYLVFCAIVIVLASLVVKWLW